MKNEITRDEFMSFFRNDDSLNQLSPHDRVEVFRTIMLGSSDFKKDLINEIFVDYGVENLDIVELKY